MKEFIKIFNKVGGKEILKQYLRGHVFLYVLIMTPLLGISKKSLEILRLAVGNKLIKKIRKSNKTFIEEFKRKETNRIILESDSSRKIWVCWLQGMQAAPEVVQKCYQSLQNYITDREIILITEDNYKNYVQFPDFIQKKIDLEIISKTHMSDLLRLELLIRYGGTWIDATVFCSGKPEKYMLDSELFLFQNLKPGLDGHCFCISNWFITAKADNVILRLTLALLYEYWRKNNKLINYFIFHDFFQLAIETYPEEWKKVIPYSNSTPHILLLRLFDQYDESVWKAVKMQTCFHKLTYKYVKGQKCMKNTYFDKIIQIK